MNQRLLPLALVLLALGFGFFGWAQSRRNNAQEQTNARVIAGLALGQRDGCIATNIARATDNASHLADFRFIMQQIDFTRSSLHANYVALQKVGISKAVLNRALRQTEAGLAAQRVDALAKTWTALADCNAPASRVEDLHVYRIAVKRPPKSAMSVKNAQRVDPVGSVNP